MAEEAGGRVDSHLAQRGRDVRGPGSVPRPVWRLPLKDPPGPFGTLGPLLVAVGEEVCGGEGGPILCR